MKLKIINSKAVKTTLWEGGKTNEYIIYPEKAEYALKKFLFRISSATIEKVPSNFTQFHGFTRYLAMLEGNLSLKINGIYSTYKEHELFCFKSSDEIVSFSVGTDFNLMLHDSIIDAEISIVDTSFSSQKRFICLFFLDNSEIKLNKTIISIGKHDCILINNNDNENIYIELFTKTIVAHWTV